MKTRRWKRGLSILLSTAMVLSAAGGALTAFAQELAADPVADAAAAITAVNADTTNIAADPTAANQEKYDAKVALYNTAVSAYKAVPTEDRDALDATMMVKFLTNYINREAYVDVRDANPDAEKTPAIQVADRKKVMEGLAAELGAHGERDAAVAFADTYLWEAVEGIVPAGSGSGSAGQKPALEKLTADQLSRVVTHLGNTVDALADLDLDTLVYLGGLNTMYTSDNERFYAPYFANTNPNANYVKNLVATYGQALEVQTPWDGEIPANPKAPANTAMYEEDYRAYLEAAKAYQEANEEKANHQADHYLAVMEKLAADGSALAPAMNVWLDMYEAFVDFRENQRTEKAAAAVAQYNEITAETSFVKTAVTALGGISGFYYAPYYNGSTWVYSNYGLSSLNSTVLKNVLVTANQEAYDAFTAYINGLDMEHITNEQIAQAQTLYKAVNNAFKYNMPDSENWKYYDVLCAYTPEHPANVPSDDAFEEEIASWEPTEVAYPDYETATPENIQTYIIDALEDTLLGALNSLVPEIGAAGGLNGYITETVYTNQALATVLGLYHTLGSLDLSVDAMGMAINVGEVIEDAVKPSELSGWLTEEKFAGAKAKIDALVTAGNDATAGYAQLAFANGDWGFQDGDQEGFINALAAMLRPMVDLLTGVGPMGGVVGPILYMPNTVEKDGNYTYGAYEYLIPVLEGLGLEGVISSEAYSDAFFAAGTKGEQMDAAVLPILRPIFSLVEKIAAAPLNELLTLLPRLAYLVDSGTLDSSVKAALGTSSLLSGLTGSLDLSANGLNGLISSLIPTLLGEDTSFELSAIDWSALAHAGTAVLADSVSSTNLHRVDVQADKPAAFMLAANYLFDNLIANETNWNEVRSLLSGIEGVGTYLPIVDSLIGELRGQGVDGLIISFLPEVNPDPSTPPAEGGNTSPGDGSTASPDTGDAVLASAAAVFALSGAALVLLHRGRKYSR